LRSLRSARGRRGHRAGDGVRPPRWRLARGPRREPRASRGPAFFDVCARGAAADPSGEAAGDPRARLDDHRHPDRMSRPQLRRTVSHHAPRYAHLSPPRRDGRAAAQSVTVELPRAQLAPGYTVSRIVKGGWQLAGGHGPVDAAAAMADMDRFVDAGITTFD